MKTKTLKYTWRINIYEEKIYPFEKCEYAATTNIEIKHAGVLNLCDEWEVAATTTNDLIRHIKVKREGINDHCEKYEFTTCQRDLRKHVKIQHDCFSRGSNTKFRPMFLCLLVYI